jgi:integrase/recombinase XerD
MEDYRGDLQRQGGLPVTDQHCTTEVVRPERSPFDEGRMAVAGFLARYSDPTRASYAADLRGYLGWCAAHDLAVFAVKRAHIELWGRTLEEAGLARSTIGRRLSTVAGFYRFAVIDGLIEHSPAEYVRRPRIDTESTTLGLDRMELGAFIAQGAAGGPVDHALACLLGLLGLRVSEACSINIEALGTERGHRTVTVLGKGSKLAVIPLPPRVGRAVDLAAAERVFGPLLLTRSGRRMNRHAATRIVRRLSRRAGITKHISPHSLRHSFITAALDAGVPLRDVQIAARHADPRTTTRYDRARNNLDRHASYIVTAFVAGAG